MNKHILEEFRFDIKKVYIQRNIAVAGAGTPSRAHIPDEYAVGLLSIICNEKSTYPGLDDPGFSSLLCLIDVGKHGLRQNLLPGFLDPIDVCFNKAVDVLKCHPVWSMRDHMSFFIERDTETFEVREADRDRDMKVPGHVLSDLICLMRGQGLQFLPGT